MKLNPLSSLVVALALGVSSLALADSTVAPSGVASPSPAPSAMPTPAPSASPSPAAPVIVLSCESEPGYKLCEALDQAFNDQNWTCTGDACYGIWQNEERSYERLIDKVEDLLPPHGDISLEIGRKAQKLAKAICAETDTGNGDALANLTSIEDETLNNLLKLQKRAGLPRKSQVTCNMQVN